MPGKIGTSLQKTTLSDKRIADLLTNGGNGKYPPHGKSVAGWSANPSARKKPAAMGRSFCLVSQVRIPTLDANLGSLTLTTDITFSLGSAGYNSPASPLQENCPDG